MGTAAGPTAPPSGSRQAPRTPGCSPLGLVAFGPSPARSPAASWTSTAPPLPSFARSAILLPQALPQGSALAAARLLSARNSRACALPKPTPGEEGSSRLRAAPGAESSSALLSPPGPVPSTRRRPNRPRLLFPPTEGAWPGPGACAVRHASVRDLGEYTFSKGARLALGLDAPVYCLFSRGSQWWESEPPRAPRWKSSSR